MQYDLDPELAKIACIKPPRSIQLYPLINRMLREFPCRFSGSVLVSRREIPAYQGEKI